VEFAPGTILKLCADDKQLTAAMQFNEIARRISGRIPAVKNRDQKAIFDQYQDILELRNRLASEQSEDKRWKADALDVRNRFVFYCAEYNKDNLVTPTATYTNATAKSGGEQEKLMAFCLAGALSYNLADHASGDSRPVFAQLMIEVLQPAGLAPLEPTQEIPTDILYARFDLPFRLRPIGTAQPRRESPVASEVKKYGVPNDLAPLIDVLPDRLHTVIKNLLRHTAELLKCAFVHPQ
jgi:hypothetical protein